MLKTHRVRAVFAGLLATALAFTAAPAMAADEPEMTVDRDTFTAGSWGDGINVTVTGVPEEAETVTFSIGSYGENGGGAVEFATQDTVDGVTEYTQLLAPDDSLAPVAPDADGYPKI